MATYSLGTSIKIQTAVFFSGVSGNVATVRYSVPANSYAILNISNTSASQVFYIEATGTFDGSGSNTTSPSAGVPATVYIGPGHYLYLQVTGTWSVTGVEFLNSP